MTVSIDLVRSLYDHATWANGRLLDQAAMLTNEELHRPIPGTTDSIQSTFVHNLDGQEFWLRCLQQEEPVPDLVPADFADLTSLRHRWQEADGAMNAYLSTRTDANLAENVHYRFVDGGEGSAMPWQILVHQALHQQQHRS